VKDRFYKFWNKKINPITGWKKAKSLKNEPIKDIEILKKDQATLFKPKGFR